MVLIFNSVQFLVYRTDNLEGDIRLSPNVQSLVEGGVKKNKENVLFQRGAVTDKIFLWTHGIVPYVIDSAFGKNSPGGTPI